MIRVIGGRVRRLDVAARPAEAGVGQEHLSESVKLTSATSSPLSVIWGGAAVLDGVSAVGTAVATDAARSMHVSKVPRVDIRSDAVRVENHRDKRHKSGFGDWLPGRQKRQVTFRRKVRG